MNAISEPFLRRLETAAAACLAAAALFLQGTYFSGAGGLWRDEVSALAIARQPDLAGLWRSLAHDLFPPLHFVVLRAWTWGFGATDASVRLLGLGTAISGLAAAWLCARSLGAPLPLATLALLGLSPLAVDTAAYARPYGLGGLLVLLAAAALGRWAAGGGRLLLAAAFCLSVLSLQCMYRNAVLLGAVCLGLSATSPRGRARRAWLVLAGAAALAAPHLANVAAVRPELAIGQYEWSPAKILDPLRAAFASPFSGAEWLWAALLAAALAAGWRWRRTHPAGLRASLIAASSGAGLAAALSLAGIHIYPRYFVAWMPWVGFCLDAAAERPGAAAGPRLARVVLCAAALGFLPSAWRQAQARQTNIDSAAALVGARAASQDLVVVNPWYFAVTFGRYYSGRAAWTAFPPMDELPWARYDVLRAAMARPDAARPALDRMAAALRRGGTVWWIGAISFAQPAGLPPAPLPGTGWYSGPYIVDWSRQGGRWLQERAAQVTVTDPSHGADVRDQERVLVLGFSGWRGPR